ncbi:nucleotidyltransferase family protein [Isosphaeraceae bacterium EP7]
MIAAVVAAAGKSLRMGRPKLILPLAGRSVIGRLIHALKEGGADPVLAVVPPNGDEIEAECLGAGAQTLRLASPTADMRATIEAGLRLLMSRAETPEAILICPGDSPGTTARLVSNLIAHWHESPASIVMPEHQGKRGHPLLLPWSVALEIQALPHDVGINTLVRNHSSIARPLQVGDDLAAADLDTPEDYLKWQDRLGDAP